MASIKVEQKVVCLLSSADIAGDLGWPRTLKPSQFLRFALPFISSQWVNLETSNLVYRLIIASPSLWTTNCP